MTSFSTVLHDAMAGKLTGFDRLIFHGHLTALFHPGSVARLLWKLGCPLKNFGAWAAKATVAVKERQERMAREAGRPMRYLDGPQTVRRGRPMHRRASRRASPQRAAKSRPAGPPLHR